MAAQRVRTVSTPLLSHHHHIKKTIKKHILQPYYNLTGSFKRADTRDPVDEGHPNARFFGCTTVPTCVYTYLLSPLLVHIRRFALWETDRIGRCGRCNPTILAEGDFSGPVCWWSLLSFDTMSSSCKQRTHVPPPVSTYKRLSL